MGAASAVVLTAGSLRAVHTKAQKSHSFS